MSYEIIFSSERCVACGACTVACMDQNDILVQQGQPPLRRAFQTEERAASGGKMAYFSVACEHCDDAPCICACPVGCLSKDSETGFTVFDTSGCI